MEITETTGARFKLLLERLRAGDSLTRGNLTLRLVGAQLQCDVTTLMQPESATETRARDHLARGRAELEALLREAPALAAIAGSRPVRYCQTTSQIPHFPTSEIPHPLARRVVWKHGMRCR